jgi:hypothetical protein
VSFVVDWSEWLFACGIFSGIKVEFWCISRTA